MSSAENITKCITCGAELHPERAKKYNYCMKPDCQAKNLRGLTMVAVGVNKSAEQYMLLDEDTKTELAEGKYHDQRRGSFGVPTSAPAGSPGEPATPAQATPAQATPAKPARPAHSGPAQAVPDQRPVSPAPAAPATASQPRAVSQPRQPGTPSQRRLAVLYNQQGLRPDEIARKLGLSRYEVTQIILAARK
jgi:DNA-binding CsgD family transcriptional regulator